MLSILRFIFRLIVFLVALAAIVVIVGGGVWYVQTQGRGGTTIASARCRATASRRARRICC